MKDNFEKLVGEALMALPKRIRDKMDNVAIVIEKRPTRSQFLGLYQGVPLNAWGSSFGMRLPDKITIFQEPIENFAHSEEEIKEIVKNTVWHEVAHHFGYGDEWIEKEEERRGKTK